MQSDSTCTTITPRHFPPCLTEIPDPPKQLYVRGTLPPHDSYAYVAVVGSREYTPYGKQVCERLIRGLAGYPVVIVSGLALGIDGIAHKAALDTGLHTVAIPGSGLSDRVLYPASHRPLARTILEHGGALLSEFPDDFKPRKESFPQRNRIMAGISRAVLVIEATERSGTLITARLAMDYNRDVFAVPGPIHAETSKGPHMLIKSGAAVITSSEDILTALHIASEERTFNTQPLFLSPEEQLLFHILKQPLPRDQVVRNLTMSASEANSLLASLEIKGYIEERLGMLEWKQ